MSLCFPRWVLVEKMSVEKMLSISVFNSVLIRVGDIIWGLRMMNAPDPENGLYLCLWCNIKKVYVEIPH